MLRSVRSCTRWWLVPIAALAAAPAAAVSIDWVPVGAAGNACDTQVDGCFGSVATTYRIASTEVTNAQYAAFLNAVAATDTHGLYNPSMAWAGSGFGGINRSGSDGSYAYSAAAGRESMPVTYVSFYDALRFANWMHNGQPGGAQGSATTEDGSYTITAGGISANSIGRNAGASIVLTSEDEWYKAAYYDPSGGAFFDYPAGSDAQTACADVTAAANSANCGNAVGAGSGGLTPAGSYTGAASPFGTFDQGGNLWEWNEAILFDDFRGLRGGAFNHAASNLGADVQSLNDPFAEANNVGFRVALVPEPGSGPLLAAGLLAAGLLALGRRRRARRA
jgi:formylglycine-generating enzyme required for sulfatase activity